jgi:hypothetical protein
MNNRQRANAILHYQSYDRIPVVHFGFWDETLLRWAREGHISQEEAYSWADGNEVDYAIGTRLGFDFNWYSCFHWNYSLLPAFEPRLVRDHPGGGREMLNSDGVVILQKDDAGAIPSEIEHLLVDRKSWEGHYLPRLLWSLERVDRQALDRLPAPGDRPHPIGLHCGSLLGRIRDMVGLVGLSYLIADDPDLVTEMIAVTADLCYNGVKAVLERQPQFDFAHFWEDICYRAGPLVSPQFFSTQVGPYYKRITDLVNSYGIDIVSLDCDGRIDALIPTWFHNGVNTMFPIEVGVWKAEITPWRQQYGPELRGVGGVSKTIFAHDRSVIDDEITRQRPLVDLGGYIPCLDHRIPPDAIWENVQYFCDHMHQVFG